MTKPRKKRRKPVRRKAPADVQRSCTPAVSQEIIDMFNEVIGPPRPPLPGRYEVLVVRARERSRPCNWEPMVQLVLKVEGYDTFLAHLVFGGPNDKVVADFKASIGVSRVEILEELIGKIAYVELEINEGGYCNVGRWLR